jgi:hypothetical protein
MPKRQQTRDLFPAWRRRKLAPVKYFSDFDTN